jgi:hypothetical protein
MNEDYAFYTFLHKHLDRESSCDNILADWLHALVPSIGSVLIASTDSQRWRTNVRVLCLMLFRHKRERKFSLFRVTLVETYDDFIPYGPLPGDPFPSIRSQIDEYFFHALFSWEWNKAELLELPLLFRYAIDKDETRFLLAHVRDAMEMTRQGVTENLLLSLLLELTPVAESLCNLCVSYVWDVRTLWIQWNVTMDLWHLDLLSGCLP